MKHQCFFAIYARTSRTPKFRHAYVITFGDFMVIVEPRNNFSPMAMTYAVKGDVC